MFGMNSASPETILRACLVIQLGVISMNANHAASGSSAGSGRTAIRVLAILARGLAVLICLPALLLLIRRQIGKIELEQTLAQRAQELRKRFFQTQNQ